MSNIVDFPYFYIADPTKDRPIFNGSVFIGVPDLDPTVVANQLPISVRQEDGTDVPVSQPVKTNAGGTLTYLGSPVQIVVDGAYSMAVLNSAGSQVYYVANIIDSSSSSAVSYNEGDTGAIDRTVEARLQDYVSLKDFVTDATGATDMTTEVQAALNTAKVIDTGWPSDIYLCGSITVPANTIVTGRGDFKTAAGLTDSWMKNASFPEGDAGIVLEHFTVNGNKAERSDNEITISMQKTDGLEMSKIKVRDSPGTQISITGGTTKNMLMAHCEAHDGDGGGIDINGVVGSGNRVICPVTDGHASSGLVLQGGTKYVTVVAPISNDNGTTNGNGISAGEANQCLIAFPQTLRNSSTAFAGSGIGINPTNGDCESHIIGFALSTGNGDDGIDCAPGSGATSRYHAIGGCILSGNTGAGYNESGAGTAGYCNLFGLMTRFNGGPGMQLDNAGHNTGVSNMALDNGQVTANSPGIRSASDKNILVANLTDNILGSTQTNISLNGAQQVCFANMLGTPSTGAKLSIASDADHLIGMNAGYSMFKSSQTFVAATGATPDFSAGETFTMTQVGATDVPSFVAGNIGQIIYVIFLDGNTTLKHTAALRLNGGVDFTPNANDLMCFKYTGITGWSATDPGNNN